MKAKDNLDREDIIKIISHYEFLKFEGVDREHCDRVLHELRKRIKLNWFKRFINYLYNI